MYILGAGLSGCLAGMLIPDSEILEPKKESIQNTHQAILRFRSDQIGRAIGIPFKKVVVHKGIWHNGEPVQLHPKYIVRYSRKVSDSITARSIIHQESVERYIAPIDFHQQLKHKLKDRIEYNIRLHNEVFKCYGIANPIISTLPMYVLSDLTGVKFDFEGVGSNISKIQKIYVSKYRIENCDLYATNYFTDSKTSVYRASINGNELIIESILPIETKDVVYVKQSFGLDGAILFKGISNFEQINGKFAPVDEHLRKAFIYECTSKLNIYSLGRLAIMKNIVLDDVYKDILRIKEWINQSEYDKVAKNGY